MADNDFSREKSGAVMGNIVSGAIWLLLGGILYLAHGVILLAALADSQPRWLNWILMIVISYGGIVMMLIGFFFITHGVVQKAVKSALTMLASDEERKRLDDFWARRRNGIGQKPDGPRPEAKPPVSKTSVGSQPNSEGR